MSQSNDFEEVFRNFITTRSINSLNTTISEENYVKSADVLKEYYYKMVNLIPVNKRYKFREYFNKCNIINAQLWETIANTLYLQGIKDGTKLKKTIVEKIEGELTC